MTTTLGKGELFEFRVQRALFWRGAFVRRGVDLKEFFAPEPLNLSDVDVFGIVCSPFLTPERVVVECKDRKGGAKEVDRILWLLGLARHLDATQVVFAKPSIAERVQSWAEGLGVSCVDESALLDIESRLGLTAKDWHGSHTIELAEALARCRKELSDNRRLKAHFNFLRGAFWYTENTERCERLAAVFAAYVDERAKLSVEARDWLLSEGVVALCTCTLTATSQRLFVSPARFATRQEESFSSGVAPAHELRELAGRIDDYYQKKLRDVTAAAAKAGRTTLIPVRVPRIAPAIAQPPKWYSAFIALVERTSRRQFEAAQLLRYADLFLYESLVKRGSFPAALWQASGAPDVGVLHKLLQNVAYFLNREWGVPDADMDSLWKKQTEAPAPPASDGMNAGADSKTQAKALGETTAPNKPEQLHLPESPDANRKADGEQKDGEGKD